MNQSAKLRCPPVVVSFTTASARPLGWGWPNATPVPGVDVPLPVEKYRLPAVSTTRPPPDCQMPPPPLLDWFISEDHIVVIVAVASETPTIQPSYGPKSHTEPN